MKGGAELLGVPMPTLYGRYKEALRDDPLCSKCGYLSSDKSDLARHIYENHFQKAQKGSNAASTSSYVATKQTNVTLTSSSEPSTSSNVASTSSNVATTSSTQKSLIVGSRSSIVASTSSRVAPRSSNVTPGIVSVASSAPKSSQRDRSERRFGIRAYTDAAPTVTRNADGLYECEMCPKRFRDNSNFHKHWRRMHNPGVSDNTEENLVVRVDPSLLLD